MRKLSVILHMVIYSALWGSILGGIAMAISTCGAAGFGYALLFAVNGVFQGLLIGAIIGSVVGVCTAVFCFPPQDAQHYKLWMGISYSILFALCSFLISLWQFLAPLPNGAQYYDASQTMTFAVVIPAVLTGLLAFPVGRRLASWYIAQPQP